MRAFRAILSACLIMIIGCGDTRQRDATETYWEAQRSLNLEVEMRQKQQPEPQSPQELLESLSESDEIFGEYLKRSSAISTDFVDPDVVNYIAEIHALCADARRQLADVRLHLRRIINHQDRAQGWWATFNYVAEGFLGSSSSIDSAIGKASDLEQDFVASLQRFEDVRAEIEAMNETEIKLRKTMHERYGISLPALDDSTSDD